MSSGGAELCYPSDWKRGRDLPLKGREFITLVASPAAALPAELPVMRQGRITGELPGRTTQEQIMRYAAFDITPTTTEERPA